MKGLVFLALLGLVALALPPAAVPIAPVLLPVAASLAP